MRTKRVLILLCGLLGLSLACSATDSLVSGSTKAADSNPATTSTESNHVLFQDNFQNENGGWAVSDDSDGSLGYKDGQYFIKILTDQMLMWSRPNGESYSNIHMEMDAQSVGEASDTAFGFICNYQDSDNFYMLGLNADGIYAIKKYVDGVKTFLTGRTDTWVNSDVIPTQAGTYHMGADCGKGKLALYVEGKKVASVSDSDLLNGDVGLFAFTFDTPNGEIHYSNFVVTELP
jgi:hypothetical protein